MRRSPSGDRHRDPAASRCGARQLLRRHRCGVRRRWGTSTPSFSAICCASSIMRRATSRVPGSVQSTSSVAWVSAEIGLKDRLPQSFTQISSRRRGRTGAFRPADCSACDSATARSDFEPSGSPSEKRLPSMWRMVPGRADLGGRIDDAAQHAVRAEAIPLHIAGIDAVEAVCLQAGRRSCGSTTRARHSRR